MFKEKFETEHVPTPEEIHEVFKKLTKKEYKEVRHIGDAEGPYLLEVAIPGRQEGEVTQYEYNRRGQHKEVNTTETEIHKVYYEDGIPVSGELMAKFVNGKWEIL